MEGDGGEGDGGLFAGGEQHVHFAFWWLLQRSADAFGETDEAVGDAAHSGDNDNDLIALAAAFGDAAGDVFNAFGVGDGGASVFLNDESHYCGGWGNGFVAYRPRVFMRAAALGGTSSGSLLEAAMAQSGSLRPCPVIVAVTRLPSGMRALRTFWIKPARGAAQAGSTKTPSVWAIFR